MLTERTRHTHLGREAIAADVEAVAAKHGATVERAHTLSQRHVRLLVTTVNGLSVNVNVDGRKRDDGYVLPWHFADEGSTTMLTQAFGSVDNDQTFPASHLAADVSEMLELLDRGLSMAKDGSAFCGGAEAKRLARHRDGVRGKAASVARGKVGRVAVPA